MDEFPKHAKWKKSDRKSTYDVTAFISCCGIGKTNHEHNNISKCQGLEWIDCQRAWGTLGSKVVEMFSILIVVVVTRYMYMSKLKMGTFHYM